MSFSESGWGRGMAAGSLKDGLKEGPKQVYTPLLFYIGSHMRGVQRAIECAAHDSSDAVGRFFGPTRPGKGFTGLLVFAFDMGLTVWVDVYMERHWVAAHGTVFHVVLA